MSCVYIIRHKHTDNCYIGSTMDFDKRKKEHMICVVSEKQTNYTHPVYQFIRENDGWDNFDMVKICDCDENERLKMEQHHMDFIKPSLNCKRALGFDHERRKIYKKKNDREYYLNNKEKIYNYSNEYRNQKVICDCGKEVSRHARGWSRMKGTHNHKN